MKKIKYFILIGIMAIATTSYSQTANKDEMIKKIFAVLKNKDEEGFIKLFPDAATIKAFIGTFIETDTSADFRDMMRTYFDEMTDSSMQAELRRDFRKSIKKGELKEVDWSQSVLVSYNADSIMVEEDGIKGSKLAGKIYFNADRKEYFLEFDDVIWFDNKGWYGVEIKRVDEKSKENEPNDDVWDGAEDSTSMLVLDSIRMIDSIIKAEEIKPVQKPKQPVKNKPIKSKAQAPASKQD